MKNFILASLASVSVLVAAAPSYALVQQVTSCQSNDGEYSLAINDNQGIGLQRTSHLYAEIKDASGDTVGSYAVVKEAAQVQPVSFAHSTYIDKATSGNEFKFFTASTNTGAAVKAVLKDGRSIDLGLICN